MRSKCIYVLKILVLWFCLISDLQGSISAKPYNKSTSVASASRELYKRFLRTQSLPFEDCGSQYDILYLDISCCSEIPCQMKRGTKPTVYVIFDDEGSNTTLLKHQVRWVFNAIRTEASITPDPCDGNLECLKNNNDGKSYWATINVNNTLPTISGSMIWEAADANNNNVICFKVPVVVIN
ncbi:uncharacterized protein LOC119685487 [Teleopsis dalmanni]|uniref:uncharacterized protein LOC119685487 n=1 Tax=Teleopsis dalmanni TaxID=139649 RepID=UPI0018CE30B3|nr:uncharacterized protein LOC119685487 [Teleopsis dalmanni]